MADLDFTMLPAEGLTISPGPYGDGSTATAWGAGSEFPAYTTQTSGLNYGRLFADVSGAFGRNAIYEIAALRSNRNGSQYRADLFLNCAIGAEDGTADSPLYTGTQRFTFDVQGIIVDSNNASVNTTINKGGRSYRQYQWILTKADWPVDPNLWVEGPVAITYI